MFAKGWVPGVLSHSTDDNLCTDIQNNYHSNMIEFNTSKWYPQLAVTQKIVAFVYPNTGSCTWWRHQMETFSALLALCAGNSPVTGELPSQGPVTRSFDVFFDVRLNERLSKQSRRRWFEMPSRPLWRQCNESCGLTVPGLCLIAGTFPRERCNNN